jgi:uncharacterized protein
MNRKPNTIDYVEFPVPSASGVVAAKRFYDQAFGWVFRDWGDEYAESTSSGIGSGFNADSGQRSSQPLVVIYVTDLEMARTKVVAAGGTITRDIFPFPGGRRFHFRDPAGNELAAWSNQGM